VLTRSAVGPARTSGHRIAHSNRDLKRATANDLWSAWCPPNTFRLTAGATRLFLILVVSVGEG
jgi:hypothetical protein